MISLSYKNYSGLAKRSLQILSKQVRIQLKFVLPAFVYNKIRLQYSSEHRVKKNVTNGYKERPGEREIDCDYIGPPDKLSNLRPVVRQIPVDETAVETTLRLKRIEAEKWNQSFWANHNQKFIKVQTNQNIVINFVSNANVFAAKRRILSETSN